jgi:thiamine pyrophosphate-dependent acetolactate synthase large subunit-like protein
MDGRFIATRIGYSTPDFYEVARSFGINSLKIKTTQDFAPAQDFLIQHNKGPILIEIEMDNRAKALPKIDRFTKLSDL